MLSETPRLGGKYFYIYDRIHDKAVFVTVTDIRYGNARVMGWNEHGELIEEWAAYEKLSVIPGLPE